MFLKRSVFIHIGIKTAVIPCASFGIKFIGNRYFSGFDGPQRCVICAYCHLHNFLHYCYFVFSVCTKGKQTHVEFTICFAYIYRYMYQTTLLLIISSFLSFDETVNRVQLHLALGQLFDQLPLMNADRQDLN